MGGSSHVEMHREHAGWMKDDAFWRDELAVWERETRQAIKDLPRLEEALRAHATVLRKHGASVRLYEQDVAKHERALVEYEKGEAPEALIEMAGSHTQELEHHLERRRVHEDVKHRHHVLMVKWRLLTSALVEPQAGKSTG